MEKQVFGQQAECEKGATEERIPGAFQNSTAGPTSRTTPKLIEDLPIETIRDFNDLKTYVDRKSKMPKTNIHLLREQTIR